SHSRAQPFIEHLCLLHEARASS
ncbi:mCG140462, partial [Mus musculus]